MATGSQSAAAPIRWTFEKISAPHCRVGESIVWDDETQDLLWADIPAGRIYALNMHSREERSWVLPEPVGSFGLGDDGRLVVGLPSGAYLYDRARERLEFLVDPEPEQAPNRPKNRLNDGKVGPDGAFWVGSMHAEGPTACLYRITGDGTCERKVEGLSTSNGLAFSADGRLLYHSDSKQCWIERHDLDPATGALSGRRRLVELDETLGRPDGAAMDSAGRYWSAGVSAGVLNCFSADGTLVSTVAAPVLRPTMPCFGGPDMRTLFISSIRRPEEADDDQGDIFMTRVDVPGVAVGRFRTGR